MPPRPPEVRPEPRVRPVDCLDAVRPCPPPSPRAGFEGGPALCAAEERLRRGWVSVRGELVICLEHEMKGVFGMLQKALEVLRRLRANPDEMPRLAPEAVHILNTFSGYARRAESALARYGLKTADGSPHELG